MKPKIGHEVSTIAELVDLVAAGGGIAFASRRSLPPAQDPRIVLKPLPGKGVIETGLVHRTGDSSEFKANLISALRAENSASDASERLTASERRA